MARIVFLISIFFGTTFGIAATGEVLIVENPRALTLLDAYQRSVPQKVKAGWPSFLPIFLGQTETLPDGITKVRQARILGQRFFLILDASGKPQGLEQSGFHKWISRAIVFGDTVQVKSGNDLPLLHPQTMRVIRQAKAGQKLVRLFKFRSYYYVRTWQPPYAFAFLSARYGYRLQKINKNELKSARQWQDFIQQIYYFVNRKNRIYKKLFDYFRDETGRLQNTPPPQWQVEQKPQRLQIRFSDPSWLRRWKRSSRIFADELRALCRSFHYELKSEQNGTYLIQRIKS